MQAQGDGCSRVDDCQARLGDVHVLDGLPFDLPRRRLGSNSGGKPSHGQELENIGVSSVGRKPYQIVDTPLRGLVRTIKEVSDAPRSLRSGQPTLVAVEHAGLVPNTRP